ncbi:MAG: Sensor protein ZraS [Firmicutes bacterium]|nr:Sensor protein ZraS [candidate division NPL-UPA2 bacterium]
MDACWWRRSKRFWLNTDMEEIALHILDLVQNCVEAGASEVSIAITECRRDNLLRIMISDNGRGMDQATLVAVTDPFFTTRSTRKVGLGIPLLKAAAEQCNGSFIIESSEGKGTQVVASFALDHIDRAPLGSMADTLAAVFAVHHVDVHYLHDVDGKVFMLDSKEIRQLCGDELRHPRVIVWLRAYIEEHEKQVRGEQ